MRRFSIPLVLILTGVVVLTAAGPAGARAVDRSYGDHGVVELGGIDGSGESQSALGVQSFGPDANGSAFVIFDAYRCEEGSGCGDVYWLSRYGINGPLDKGFGRGGRQPLPDAGRYSVTADGDGALVVGFDHQDIVIRRFTAGGRPDPSFGRSGVVRASCRCGGEVHLHALVGPDGGALIDIDESVGEFSFGEGTRVKLLRFRPDGSLDRAFGSAGRTSFAVRGPGAPTSLVETPDGATVIGASGFARSNDLRRLRNVYLRRVFADGRPDRRFDAHATRSLKALETRGRFPTLGAVVPRGGGGFSVLGYEGETGGFLMRLDGEGRLVRDFGKNGVRRLPFTVDHAVPGSEGSIFVVGSPGKDPHGYVRAFRLLADGGLDPAYRRAHGIPVPVSGVKIAVTALGDGRALVTDNGNSYCRESCPPVPSMVRFLD